MPVVEESDTATVDPSGVMAAALRRLAGMEVCEVTDKAPAMLTSEKTGEAGSFGSAHAMVVAPAADCAEILNVLHATWRGIMGARTNWLPTQP